MRTGESTSGNSWAVAAKTRWTIRDVLVPRAQWDLGEARASRSPGRVQIALGVTHRPIGETGLASSGDLDLEILDQDTDERTGSLSLRVVVLSQLHELTRDELIGDDELMRAFSEYAVRAIVGHARAVVLRMGQEAGLPASLVLPEAVEIPSTVFDQGS